MRIIEYNQRAVPEESPPEHRHDKTHVFKR